MTFTNNIINPYNVKYFVSIYFYFDNILLSVLFPHHFILFIYVPKVDANSGFLFTDIFQFYLRYFTRSLYNIQNVEISQAFTMYVFYLYL